MIYGILEGNNVHLSEIARSLNENISLVKEQIDEERAVIVIDNFDITKPCSRTMRAITNVRDGSTCEIKNGYYTVEAAVLSKDKKMPMSVYEKVYSSAEKGFISETH